MIDVKLSELSVTLDLDFENVGSVYEFFSKIGPETETEKCLAFLESNFEVLLADKDAIPYLPFPLLLNLLQREFSTVAEVEKVKLLFIWQQNHASFDLTELLRVIRWCNVSAADYAMGVRPLSIMTDDQYFEWYKRTKLCQFSITNFVQDLINKFKNQANVANRECLTFPHKENVTSLSCPLVPESQLCNATVANVTIKTEEVPVIDISDDDSESAIDSSYNRIMEVAHSVYTEHPYSVRMPNCTISKAERSQESCLNRNDISSKAVTRLVSQICNKVFRYAAARVRRHIATVHFNEKNFTCDYCGKSYTQKPTLMDHIEAVHINVRCYRCDICGNMYTTKSYLQMHVTRVHDGCQVCHCEYCGVRYKSRQCLKHHILRHHMNVAIPYESFD
ncbi:zinc finger protein 658B-like protein [Leptotrombidium deliense]|uniref:Zinc finger protein 658B-like protein n=1 Tax=Leptotrombidium deliense TaxID=299467 RepID=A0A443SPF8_9ACAR|nr:zinc finger protein 658B-like protein [Leptotrombidium deliense]